jgi:hypothetical protein
MAAAGLVGPGCFGRGRFRNVLLLEVIMAEQWECPNCGAQTLGWKGTDPLALCQRCNTHFSAKELDAHFNPRAPSPPPRPAALEEFDKMMRTIGKELSEKAATDRNIEILEKMNDTMDLMSKVLGEVIKNQERQQDRLDSMQERINHLMRYHVPR